MAENILQRKWIRWVSTGIVLAIMIVMFCLSAEEGDKSDSRSFPIGDAAMESGIFENSIFDGAKESYKEQGLPFWLFVQRLVRKTAHFLGYLLLGAALLVCVESWTGGRKLNGILSFLIGALYAASDEWHQSYIPGRSGRWEDVGIDAAGVAVGVLLTMLIVKLIRKHIAKKEGNIKQSYDRPDDSD